MKIAITLTSSLSVGEEYINSTREIAQILAKGNFGIIYGGTEYGMMKELAESYKESNGKNLVGVMSKELENVTKNYKAFPNLDEAIWVETIGERIRKMIDEADGFIILPGGYGTLEEMMSIIGGKANKLYDKPIIILNINHYYDSFVSFFNEMQEKQFSKIKLEELVKVFDSKEGVVDYFNSYSKTVLPDKFV